jgi:N-acylmannosamine kinase
MNSKKKYIVTIDIGGTKTNLGFFLENKLVKIINFSTLKFGPDNVNKISEILQDSKKNILAICLSLTGLVNNKGYWNPINKKTLGNFVNYPIVKKLNFFFKVPVYALGDTQAAALGELYYGSGRNLSNFFYLTISTGIGGSIIQNKNLFEGKISDVGSLGHSVIKFNGKLCGCGRNGCLEAYASGNALIKNNKIKECKSTKELLTKFKNKYQTINLVNQAVEMIVQSIININTLIRIDNFIIGGSVGLNIFFYRKLKDRINKKLFPIKIKKAKLHSKAELYGCFAYINNKLYMDDKHDNVK